jgi:hypothetical protein
MARLKDTFDKGVGDKLGGCTGLDVFGNCFECFRVRLSQHFVLSGRIYGQEDSWMVQTLATVSRYRDKGTRMALLIRKVFPFLIFILLSQF